MATKKRDLLTSKEKQNLAINLANTYFKTVTGDLGEIVFFINSMRVMFRFTKDELLSVYDHVLATLYEET